MNFLYELLMSLRMNHLLLTHIILSSKQYYMLLWYCVETDFYAFLTAQLTVTQTNQNLKRKRCHQTEWNINQQIQEKARMN